jgi:hypothetical protein
MSKMDEIDDLMAQIHKAQCTAILKKLKSGEISAQDLNAATNFLKSNGITSNIHMDKNLKGVKDKVDELAEDDGTIEFTADDLGIDTDERIIL